MSFRRDKEQSRSWQQWINRCRNDLVAAGLPDWVYDDHLRWLCFLQEGGVDIESGWRVEMLSPTQAERFRSFLIGEYGADVDRCCLRALEQIVRGHDLG
jgi:hypothetical protein